MTTLNLQVGADADDVLARQNDSTLWTNSSIIGRVGNSNATNRGYAGISRFPSVAIGQGDTILAASMVLTSRNPQSGTTCDGDIDALDVGDASMPADYATYVGTARTTAKVAWSNLPSWGTNTLHSSPEIKTVIQEIVDRGDWSSGNALVTSVHDEDETSSTGARREWHSHDNDATRAAKLDIDFEAAAVTVGEMMAARMMGPPMTPPVPAEVVAY